MARFLRSLPAVNEATPRRSTGHSRKLLRNSQGSAQSSYLGLTAVVALAAAGSLTSFGDATQAALNQSVRGTLPESSVALASSNMGASNGFESEEECKSFAEKLPAEDRAAALENCKEADYPGEEEQPEGTETDADTEIEKSLDVDDVEELLDATKDDVRSKLDIFNACMVDATSEQARESCSAEYYGETIEEALPTLPERAPVLLPHLGSEKPAGPQRPLAESGGDFMSGFGSWLRGVTEGVQLWDLTKTVAGVVGRGVLGTFAGVGGALMGGIAGIGNGEGFFGGMKNGWSNGWNACQEGPINSGDCLGRAVVGAAAVAIAVYALPVSLGTAVAFAAKAVAAGVIYTFLVEPDTIVSAFKDVTKGEFHLPRTQKEIGKNFSSCSESPGTCVMSIAAGAGIYSTFRGVGFAFRQWVGTPVAASIMQTGAPARGIMRLPAMQQLAPKLQEMPWLLKLPGFRAGARDALGGTAAANAIKGGEFVSRQGNRTTYFVGKADDVTKQTLKNVNQANRAALGSKEIARRKIAAKTANEGDDWVVASFDQKVGNVTTTVANIKGPTSWAGKKASDAVGNVAGGATAVGIHYTAGGLTEAAAHSEKAQKHARRLDELESRVKE